MKKINSIEELAFCAESGVRVSCPETTYLDRATDANKLLGFSTKCLLAAIKKGMFAHGVPDGAEEGSFLGDWQARIKSTGLSNGDIAHAMGTSRQAVDQFLRAKSVQTRVLEKYIHTLGLK